MKRSVAIAALLLLVAASVLFVDGPERVQANAAIPDTIPAEAVEALRQKRFLRASLILRDFLASAVDTAPATVLVMAQAEAGWGDWEAVERLLAGRPWLDSVSAGAGWYLLGRSQLELEQFEESGRSLGRYLEGMEDRVDRDRAMAELRRAAALGGAGRYEDALGAYDRALELMPGIADWISVWAASAAAEAGDTAQLSARLAPLDAALGRDWGWRIRFRGYENAGDVPGVKLIGVTG